MSITTMSLFDNLLVVVLAGGRSSRMGGGHKCLLPLGDKLIIHRVLDRIDKKVRHVALSISPDSDIAAHLSQSRFACSIYNNFTYLEDDYPAFSGPLAGITTAIHHAKNHTLDWVVSVSADTPFLPDNLIEKLLDTVSRSSALIGIARSNSQTHPACGIWHASLYPMFNQLLVQNQFRSLHQLLTLAPSINVDFSCVEFDPFFNINTPADFSIANAILDIQGNLPTYKDTNPAQTKVDFQHQ